MSRLEHTIYFRILGLEDQNWVGFLINNAKVVSFFSLLALFCLPTEEAVSSAR